MAPTRRSSATMAITWGHGGGRGVGGSARRKKKKKTRARGGRGKGWNRKTGAGLESSPLLQKKSQRAEGRTLCAKIYVFGKKGQMMTKEDVATLLMRRFETRKWQALPRVGWDAMSFWVRVSSTSQKMGCSGAWAAPALLRRRGARPPPVEAAAAPKAAAGPSSRPGPADPASSAAPLPPRKLFLLVLVLLLLLLLLPLLPEGGPAAVRAASAATRSPWWRSNKMAARLWLSEAWFHRWQTQVRGKGQWLRPRQASRC